MQFVISKLEPILININGVMYPAFLPFRALAELEDRTKLGFMAFMSKFATGDFISSDLLNILYVALKHGGVELEYDYLLDMDISTKLLKSIMDGITELINRTLYVDSQLQDDNTEKKRK